MRAAALLVGLALGELVAAGPAWAAVPPERTTGIALWQGRLVASVGLQDLFLPADTARLRSGFASRVLIRLYLYRVGSTVPVTQTLRRSDVIYDIWDERFRVRVSDAAGLTDAQEVATPAQAIALSTALVRFPVADLASLEPGASYRIGFRADLNPISQELVGEVRRWLSREPGQDRSDTGDSFFGSFVSIFVNPRIEDSERQLRFFSQPFVVASAEKKR